MFRIGPIGVMVFGGRIRVYLYIGRVFRVKLW